MALDEAEVLDHARRSYLDLHKPDYRFFSVALEQRPYRRAVELFRKLVRVEEWTDREDGVSFWYELTIERRATWRSLRTPVFVC